MANSPRYAIIEDGSTFHITWQCHNKDWLLQEDWAKKLYYQLLLKYKDGYKIKIYSYCFMSNHPHLTGYCEQKKLLSDFFRLVNSMFAKGYNKKVGRRGQVVMDRFKSPRIETNADLLRVMRYIDLNPKRAGMVRHPREYRWSSYKFYAHGRKDQLLTPAPSYIQLGRYPHERRMAYRLMVEEILRCDWRKKKPYSSIPFIGNPEWVKMKFENLLKIRRKKRELWKQRRKIIRGLFSLE